MDFLRQKIMQEFGVHCYMPANGEMVSIATKPVISMDVSRTLLKRTQGQFHGECQAHVHTHTHIVSTAGPLAKKLCPIPGTATMSGLLVMRNEVSGTSGRGTGVTSDPPCPVPPAAEPL